MFHKFVVRALLTVLCATPAVAATADSRIPLDDTSAKFLRPEHEQMQATLSHALRHERDGAVTHWKSATSRARGRIKILATTGTVPNQCRTVRITNHAARGTRKSTTVHTFCHNDAGQWIIPGLPAPPAPAMATPAVPLPNP